MLERFGHGGDLLTAQSIFGKRDEWLDFSANMNPAGPPEGVKKLFRSAWQTIIHYPDPAVRQLRARLASLHGIEPEHILVGNGAAECIDLALRAVKPKSVGLIRPCFGEYEEAAERLGCEIYDVKLQEKGQFLVNEEVIIRLAERCDTLIFGNPNNPTGQLVPQDVLKKALLSGCRLIVDEAFLDFALDEEERTLLREAAHSQRLIVIRSLTKFFAIPGLRIGYAVSSESTIHEMRRLQVPWSVNAIAQAAALEALDDSDYVERTKMWLQEERSWLNKALTDVGLTVYPGMPNYILFALPEHSPWTANTLQRALGERGILIRDASHFAGLSEKYCRCAVRHRADNEQLIDALQVILRD